MKHGYTKNQEHTNRYGIKFSVSVTYWRYDDACNAVNDWCMNEYNTAKMVLYANARKKPGVAEEEAGIRRILDFGLANALKALEGGA